MFERKDMTKKTKKSNNLLNDIHEQAEKFSRGEEIANFVSHTVGAGLSILAFIILHSIIYLNVEYLDRKIK